MLSPIVLGHAAAPAHLGALPGANAVGQEGEKGEGPWMCISLRIRAEAPSHSDEAIDGGTIEEARFETYSCPVALACGNWLCGWLRGKSTSLAPRVEARDLSLLLGGLPPGKESCARMAIRALRRALSQWPQPQVPGEQVFAEARRD